MSDFTERQKEYVKTRLLQDLRSRMIFFALLPVILGLTFPGLLVFRWLFMSLGIAFLAAIPILAIGIRFAVRLNISLKIKIITGCLLIALINASAVFLTKPLNLILIFQAIGFVLAILVCGPMSLKVRSYRRKIDSGYFPVKSEEFEDRLKLRKIGSRFLWETAFCRGFSSREEGELLAPWAGKDLPLKFYCAGVLDGPLNNQHYILSVNEINLCDLRAESSV